MKVKMTEAERWLNKKPAQKPKFDSGWNRNKPTKPKKPPQKSSEF